MLAAMLWSLGVVVRSTHRAADPSLVGYWTMDETTNSPTAYDTGAAPANNAATSGNPTFVAGKTATHSC